jgi:hypothetical protein
MKADRVIIFYTPIYISLISAYRAANNMPISSSWDFLALMISCQKPNSYLVCQKPNSYLVKGFVEAAMRFFETIFHSIPKTSM